MSPEDVPIMLFDVRNRFEYTAIDTVELEDLKEQDRWITYFSVRSNMSPSRNLMEKRSAYLTLLEKLSSHFSSAVVR